MEKIKLLKDGKEIEVKLKVPSIYLRKEFAKKYNQIATSSKGAAVIKKLRELLTQEELEQVDFNSLDEKIQQLALTGKIDVEEFKALNSITDEETDIMTELACLCVDYGAVESDPTSEFWQNQPYETIKEIVDSFRVKFDIIK